MIALGALTFAILVNNKQEPKKASYNAQTEYVQPIKEQQVTKQEEPTITKTEEKVAEPQAAPVKQEAPKIQEQAPTLPDDIWGRAIYTVNKVPKNNPKTNLKVSTIAGITVNHYKSNPQLYSEANLDALATKCVGYYDEHIYDENIELLFKNASCL